METKTKTNFLGALLMMALFLIVGNYPAAAQEKTTVPGLDKSESAKATVIATVNIYDAKAERAEDNSWKVSFDVFNRIGVQPEVRYAVQLLSEDQKNLVDSQVYPEVLFLGENQTIKKEISYTPPKWLIGKYQLWLVSQNEKGLPLARVKAGDVALLGTGRYVKIDSSACSLEVSGDAKKYQPRQGVDVSNEETMTLVCPAENLTAKEFLVTPSFKTTFRTVFGRTVSEEKGESISLKVGEKKTLKINIPMTEAPQSYDVSVVLADEQGLAISGPVLVHYVLRGVSGTIQNVTLSQNDYSQGKTTEFSVFWSGRADSFPGARNGSDLGEKTFLNISASDANGKACLNPIKKEIDSQKPSGLEKVEAVFAQNCQNGKASASLLDEKGKVLDEKLVDLGPGKAGASVPVSEGKKTSLFVYLFFIFLALSLVLAVVIVYRKRKTDAVLFVLFFLSGMLWAGSNVKADTFSWSYGTFEANINKNTYCRGETMTITGNGSFSVCSNVADVGEFSMRGRVQSGGLWQYLFQHTDYATGMGGSGSDSGTVYGAVPSSDGSYEAAVYAEIQLLNPVNAWSWYDFYFPYTVSGSCSGEGSPAACGDGSCNGSENCASCPSDCGTCSGCGTLSGTSCGPLESDCPPVAGSNYCENGDYVDGSWSGSYPGWESYWLWQCNNSVPVWCSMTKAVSVPSPAPAPVPVVSNAPGVATSCSGANFMASMNWDSVAAPFDNYQLRIDTDQNVANGFWYADYATNWAINIPAGFSGWNGFSASPGFFTPGKMYYAQVAYHTSDWGQVATSPWVAFSKSCVAPTVVTSCSTNDSFLANLSWPAFPAPLNNYRLRLDTNQNLTDGFWYADYATNSASNVPTGGFAPANFSTSPPTSFSSGTTYYAQVLYHNSDRSLSTVSPWASISKQCCTSGAGFVWGPQFPASCSDKSCLDSALPTNTCMDDCGAIFDVSNCAGVPGQPAVVPVSCGPCPGSYREVNP